MTIQLTPGYPLDWPAAYPRTTARTVSRFQVTQTHAANHLLKEIERLGYDLEHPVVVSTNIAYRRDGLPYANQKTPTDPGVAVYFHKDGKPLVFACDKYFTIAANIRAIGLTIEAIRALERHGVTQAVERTLQGFMALEHKTEGGYELLPWWEVLQCDKHDSKEAVKAQWLMYMKSFHPDKQDGDPQFAAMLNEAYDAFKRRQHDALIKTPFSWRHNEDGSIG